ERGDMEEMQRAMQQLSLRLQQQEREMKQLQEDRQRMQEELERSREAPQRHGGQQPHSVVDTRVLSKPESYAGDPSRLADWSFKMRAYLGAVDERYQHLIEKTEMATEPLKNATMEPDEWEPRLRTRFVGLLMQLMSYRFRDDIPSALAAFERLVHDYESQSQKTVDDDTKIGVALLGMENERVKEHLIRNSSRITTWQHVRDEILEITRTQQYIDSQPAPMQLGATPWNAGKPKGGKSKEGKGKEGKGKDSKGKGSKAKKGAEEASNANRDKVCFYCKKTGHVKAECRKRQKDLAAAEGSRSASARLRSDAGGPAPRADATPVGALPATPQYLMIDTCAGASVFPQGCDPNAESDASVRPVKLATATNDPVHGASGKRSRFELEGGRQVSVRYNEADVKFPIVSVGEAASQGNWFVFGPGCQAMLPGTMGSELRQAARLPEAVQLEMHRGVYWLPCAAAGANERETPLCATRAAAVVETAPMVSSSSAAGPSDAGGPAPMAEEPPATPALRRFLGISPGAASSGAGSPAPAQLEESEAARVAISKRLPPAVSRQEFDEHQLTHLPFRSWCDHCVRGKASDDAHRARSDAEKGAPRWSMDYFFLARADDPQQAKPVLCCLDSLSGAVFAAMVHKGGDRYALAVNQEALRFTGRTSIIILSDQENAVKKLVNLVREERVHDTVVLNTPKGSSASAGGIERASYEVEKQVRTMRSRIEQVYGIKVDLDHKLLPFLVRHAAWLITHYQVKVDGKTPYERLRGRPYKGQIAEFGEVVHCRDPQKAADMPKLDDRWRLGVWLGKSLASDEHYVGSAAGVQRCRSIWRRPEPSRWDKKLLEAMAGEPWGPKAGVSLEKAPMPRGVYITLDRQIKYGGTKGCPACFGDAKIHSAECRARFQDLVDRDAAARAQPAGSTAAAESVSAARGDGRPAVAEPQDEPMGEVAEDLPGARKRQKILAGLPTLHDQEPQAEEMLETLPLLAALPDDAEWQEQLLDWERDYYGTKSGKLLNKQKVYEGRRRELDNMQRLEVKEPILLSEARAQGLEVVYSKWLDDEKATPEDPDAVRSRLVATQVNTYGREDVTQATPPIMTTRLLVSMAATKTNARGEHDWLIGRHDIRVAFFHAAGSGRVVIVPPRGLAPPGVAWRALKAWYGTREASKCWGNEVTDTMQREGAKQVMVVPMMFFSDSFDYVTNCHGDDFLSAGAAAALDEVDRILDEHFDTKRLPRIGPPAHGGEAAEGQHLGRIIRWTPSGFEYEANPKHTEDLCRLAGLQPASKGAPTPATKSTAKGRRDQDDELSDEEVKTSFRQGAGTALYMSIDRPTIQFATSQVMAGMSKPKVVNQLQLH
ncbi:unnamed protein product, partial [Prorocentrum cordatum]